MGSGASTPDELETLLEDAFVLHDRAALIELFEETAVVICDEATAARGREQIARLAAAVWECGGTYLADPRQIVQAGDTGLVVGARATNVVCRGPDRTWRYAISLLCFDHTTRRDTA